jgi:hypothetical protein
MMITAFRWKIRIEPERLINQIGGDQDIRTHILI